MRALKLASRVSVTAAIAVTTLGLVGWISPVASATAGEPAAVLTLAGPSSVAGGSKVTLTSHFLVSNATAAAGEVDLSYGTQAMAYLSANNNSSPYTVLFLEGGGGGRTLFVSSPPFGSTNTYSGDILFGNTVFRTGCVARTTTISFLPTSGIANGATFEAIPVTSINKTIKITASPATRACAQPSTLGANSTARQVTVYGSNFTAGTTLSFGAGVTVTKVSVTSTKTAVASVNVSANAAIGDRNITATRPDGTRVTCTACFTITPAPAPSSVSPSTIQAGTAISGSVYGSGMTYGSVVTVSGTGVTAKRLDSWTPGRADAQITAASTAAPGTRTVTVRNPDGGVGACTNCLTVQPAAPARSSRSDRDG